VYETTVGSRASAYDVCVVGAGPAGSTCAFYLARQGKRVLLLEKERFPRDKLCGDAVCTRAQVHLERMGVLQSVVAAREGHWAEHGGFVSPQGLPCLATSTDGGAKPLVIAIKRLVLDARIARAAADAGAELVEDCPAGHVEFSEAAGSWTIHCQTEPARRYSARVLIIADGALSRLARSLGLVTTPPDAVCSRAYIEAGTCEFAADGVLFYPPSLVPGYCSVFREADGSFSYCCYVLPGGQTRLTDLKARHHEMLASDPHLRAALGPAPKLDRMRAAPLRVGGVPRSHADHLLLVGDAAGQIDPLTGEGIQYAMDAAEIAADTLAEAFAAEDWSAAFLGRYHRRWMAAFGRDFRWSRAMARAYGRYPIFLDASAAMMRRRGSGYFMEWAEAMTGLRPKRTLVGPRVVASVLREVARLRWGGPARAAASPDGLRTTRKP
jgi:geranylgeranyl reductase family protein